MASVSTPIIPLSIESLVNTIADTAVKRMSANPNVFHNQVILLKFGCPLLISFEMHRLVAAVTTSPIPAMKANHLGRESWKASIRKKQPISLKICTCTNRSRATLY